MKATSTVVKPPVVFTPVTLTLTLETQAEVDALYGIMNTPDIAGSVGFGDQSDVIRDALRHHSDYDKAMNVFRILNQRKV